MQSSRWCIGYDRAANDARPRWINARRPADLHGWRHLGDHESRHPDQVVLVRLTEAFPEQPADQGLAVWDRVHDAGEAGPGRSKKW